MSITVNIPPNDLEAIKKLTHVDDDAEAVVQAMREFLRVAKLRELKTAWGNVEFDSDWQAIEEPGEGESLPPR